MNRFSDAGSIPAISTKKSRSSERDFFIHCESNGISSRVSVYLIIEGVYHQPQAVFAFAMMRYNGFTVDDIQNFVLMIYTALP